MGAFILIKRTKGIDIQELEREYNGSIDVFNKKGLNLNQKIVNNEFFLLVFHKYNFKVDNAIQLSNKQFIVSTGTLIYNKKTGRDALVELFNDFSEDGKFLANILGHYCVIIYKKKRLYIFNDYTGLYHVYIDKSKSVISSSFLAVLKSLKKKSISTQELYEYVINGACFGDKTLINEIDLLDSKSILQLSPNLSSIYRPLYVQRHYQSSSVNEIVEELAFDLYEYFNILKQNFGDNICSALSGGVHTRLMLGLIRKVGIEPRYLYVYGDENNITGRDAFTIQIVKAIAQRENLTIDYINKDVFPKFSEEIYEELLENRYYINDGLGHEIGLFDNGSDLHYRLSRSKKGKLHLNGGGGEIFRNYWKLLDRNYKINSFFNVRYNRMDYSAFTNCFDYKSHFSILSEKVKTSLNINENRITRLQFELLQPEFDNKYWMGTNNSINNALSYALTPFGDTQIQYKSCEIPIKYKNYFSFEAALMKFIDPELAKYPTPHGIDLFNNKLKMRVKVEEFVTLNSPPWLRAYIRKHFWQQKTELFKLRGNKYDIPYYLTKQYLKRIFKLNNLYMSKYVNIDDITDPEVLSRVLTAELIITDRY